MLRFGYTLTSPIMAAKNIKSTGIIPKLSTAPSSHNFKIYPMKMNIINEDNLVRHYKGDIYSIIGEGIHTETNEKLVFYHKVKNTEMLFVRPKEMFFSNVEWNGNIVERFSPVKINQYAGN